MKAITHPKASTATTLFCARMLVLTTFGLCMVACSKTDDKKQAETPPAKDGLEAKAHPPMPEIKSQPRELKIAKIDSGTVAEKVNNAATLPHPDKSDPSVAAVAVPTVPVDSPAQRDQKNSLPQTPAMRLETRNQAMVEMLRARKAERKP